MSFLWPAMLLLLLVLPLCVLLYIRLLHRRRALATQYGSMGFIAAGAGKPIGRRRHIPPALFLASFALLLIGLARPQAVVSMPRIAGTVMLAFDVSGSMAAEDVAPSRMEAAKALARTFVEAQPAGVRIGVTAFSDGGLTVQAPTDDQDAVLAAIERVSPQRGTSIGQGILAALTAIAADAGALPKDTAEATPAPVEAEAYTPATIVVFSDGENTAPPDPLEVAQVAAERGVRIHTVGVGSASGTEIEVEGFRIHTQLDEAALEQLAAETAGGYFGADGQADLGPIYADLERRFVIEPESMEVTSLFAGAAVLVLLVGGLCSLVWFGRVP